MYIAILLLLRIHAIFVCMNIYLHYAWRRYVSVGYLPVSGTHSYSTTLSSDLPVVWDVNWIRMNTYRDCTLPGKTHLYISLQLTQSFYAIHLYNSLSWQTLAIFCSNLFLYSDMDYTAFEVENIYCSLLFSILPWDIWKKIFTNVDNR